MNIVGFWSFGCCHSILIAIEKAFAPQWTQSKIFRLHWFWWIYLIFFLQNILIPGSTSDYVRKLCYFEKTWTQSKCNFQASLAQMMWCTYMTSCCAKFFTRGSSSKHINISTHLIEVIYDQFQPQQAFLCEIKPDLRALLILNVRSYSNIKSQMRT